MSTPTVVRVSPKRRIFASFTSKNVVRSPNLSLFSSSGTMTLVVLRVAPTQPTPLVATAHGVVARKALSGFQINRLLSYVRVAVISGPGSDWKTVLTSTSTHGTSQTAAPV